MVGFAPLPWPHGRRGIPVQGGVLVSLMNDGRARDTTNKHPTVGQVVVKPYGKAGRCQAKRCKEKAVCGGLAYCREHGLALVVR